MRPKRIGHRHGENYSKSSGYAQSRFLEEKTCKGKPKEKEHKTRGRNSYPETTGQKLDSPPPLPLS